jgi:asparagine synthase (glutamine-hydrolysing)
MEFGHGGQQSGQYWRPDFHSPLLYVRDEEYVEHYRELLTDTVRRMSRTHRVLACEVSGGLDSSALFAVAANLRRKQGLPAPGLSGFTLRFDSDSEANELDYARAVGAHVGVPVHEVDPTHKPLSWYRDWARTYKEFPGYPNGVMGWDIRKVARQQGSRVLLVGVGGDEWLTGRRYYHAEELASGRWRNLYQCMQADLRDFGAKSLLWSLGRSVAVRVLPAVAQRILRTLLARTREASISHDSWLIPELREVATQRKTRFGSPSHGIAFGRAGHLAQYRMLHAPFNVLARESEERFSARLGVELRLPLWGTAMVQFAFSTPERLRRNGGMTKVLHRRAMAGLLPSSVLERTTKAQFMTTFSSYADELRDAFAAHMLKNRLEWVLPERLQEKHSQFGVASFHAAPEWMLWGLFGCMALLPEEEGEL